MNPIVLDVWPIGEVFVRRVKGKPVSDAPAWIVTKEHNFFVLWRADYNDEDPFECNVECTMKEIYVNQYEAIEQCVLMARTEESDTNE